MRLRQHIESVYLTLILDILEFSQNSFGVKDRATVDAHMDMLHPSSALHSVRSASLMLSLHILAWASALPSNSKGQCEKPQNVGWQQIQALTLFSYPLESGDVYRAHNSVTDHGSQSNISSVATQTIWKIQYRLYFKNLDSRYRNVRDSPYRIWYI